MNQESTATLTISESKPTAPAPAASAPGGRFLSRIGGWFRKGQRGNDRGFVGISEPVQIELPLNGEDGQPYETVLSGQTLLSTAGQAEPRSTFLRPWAKRDAAIENLQDGLGALAELMSGIRDSLERTSGRQDELLQYLSHLPQALQQLPESSRLQSETLKAINQRMERQSDEQSKLADILDRISRADTTHGRTLDALHERVEVMSEHDQAITQNLQEVGAAMKTLGRNSDASAEVLEQMKDNLAARDGELERILNRQGNRFTTLLAVAIFLALSALVGVSAIGYLGFETIGHISR